MNQPSDPKKPLQKPNDTSAPNWYARMHQLPEQGAVEVHHSLTHRLSQRLNLSIFFRIWFTLALIMVIAGFLVFDQLFEYIEPTSKQVLEDTLVDTGKLLSANLSQPMQNGQIYQDSYQANLDKAFTETKNSLAETNQLLNKQNNRKFINEKTLNEMSTWFYKKTHSSFRVYVTDSKGIVIYDSLPETHFTQIEGIPITQNAEGEDYSQWNDIHLTLQGRYGARSSRSDKKDGSTTIMYVAQPIVNASGKMIGVVSVGKPVATILPYINVARQRMFTTSLIIMLISLALAGLVAWWLQQSIALVTRYTHSLASDADKPNFHLGRELNELTSTIETMKHRLENRAYVTDYVHTLTHELKSPLTAIKACGELLSEPDLDEEDRLTLTQTINEQSQKLQALIDRLLLLAKVEQPNFQLNTQPLNLMQLLQSLLNNHQPSIQKRGLTVRFFEQSLKADSDKGNSDKEGSEKSLEQSLERQAVSPISLIDTVPIDIATLIKYCEKNLVTADEFWLSQAIDNIVANAIHFAESEIRIVLSHTTTNTSDDPRNSPLSKGSKLSINTLELQIINDGEPIPDYALDKVFDRYFSLSHLVSHEKAKNSTNKGTGLGLTLSKQVIEHHGGQISIKNIQPFTTSQIKQIKNNDEQNTGVKVSIRLQS